MGGGALDTRGDLIRLSYRAGSIDYASVFLSRFEYVAAPGSATGPEKQQSQPTRAVVRVLRSGIGTATLRLRPAHVGALLALLRSPSTAPQRLRDTESGTFDVLAAQRSLPHDDIAGSGGVSSSVRGIVLTGVVWQQGFLACEKWAEDSSPTTPTASFFAANEAIHPTPHTQNGISPMQEAIIAAHRRRNIEDSSVVSLGPLRVERPEDVVLLRTFLEAALRSMLTSPSPPLQR
jgi:hypothetical protein